MQHIPVLVTIIDSVSLSFYGCEGLGLDFLFEGKNLIFKIYLSISYYFDTFTNGSVLHNLIFLLNMSLRDRHGVY